MRELLLDSVEVASLFGTFGHKINFSSENVTILTAPNGFGKTAILKLIYGFFNKTLSNYSMYNFQYFILKFSDGISIRITPQDQKTENEKFRFEKIVGEKTESAFVSTSVSALLKNLPTRIFEDLVPELDQRGSDTWYDSVSRELIGFDAVSERYGWQILEKAEQFGMRRRSKTKGEWPEWLERYTASIDCRLIEAHRLFGLQNQVRKDKYYPRTRDLSSERLAVETISQQLSQMIKDRRAEYSSISQELDRSFPIRVIDRSKSKVREKAVELQRRMDQLELRRAQYIDTGILDSTEHHVGTSLEEANESIRKLLDVYIEDSLKKLSVFDDLYERISLFLDIIQEKLSKGRPIGAKKVIRCDQSDGLVVETSSGVPVPLSGLSSGEQHEIVMFFGIIFRANEKTLLLIDEPELSLHVIWQKKFVPDLLRISKENGMHVLLATHSPQIINDRRDLRVGLSA